MSIQAVPHLSCDVLLTVMAAVTGSRWIGGLLAACCTSCCMASARFVRKPLAAWIPTRYGDKCHAASMVVHRTNVSVRMRVRMCVAAPGSTRAWTRQLSKWRCRTQNGTSPPTPSGCCKVGTSLLGLSRAGCGVAIAVWESPVAALCGNCNRPAATGSCTPVGQSGCCGNQGASLLRPHRLGHAADGTGGVPECTMVGGVRACVCTCGSPTTLPFQLV